MTTPESDRRRGIGSTPLQSRNAITFYWLFKENILASRWRCGTGGIDVYSYVVIKARNEAGAASWHELKELQCNSFAYLHPSYNVATDSKFC